MNLNLNGKVAIVTGASKGIGAGIAKQLAKEGVKVVVNYASGESDADKVVGEILSEGGIALAIKADVTSASDVKRLFEKAHGTFGRIDILVNNAGIFKFGPIESVTEDVFKNQFNINVWGPVLTTQEALKYFPATGGNIVNISSSASQNPTANGSIYAATKAALDAMTVALSRELAIRNIRVNTIAPGPTVTEGVKEMGVLGTDAEQYMINATPMGRLGQPDDIASVVVFIVSDAAGWVTGDRIKASGGLQ
ncbi:3-oxoacyl-[acyl-carrier protein] reductase [Chitinophaga sp. YR573]|uniref:SDR family NAD(P)-dependent oxidoreductase n=1 Tax=Chitinophaga sp. YR573 TaxID=1881040 RepID=UPI0008C7A3FA|nr:glucose 1-dehydrogenase [Chitinophaga sp. YR573]SEV96214.1 3-oxoacyl-[acyl-carrier protein] reductase [Chitinophaga sp. YR573]